MPRPSVAEYYHERTKYTPEGLQRAGKQLDFDAQPEPFKRYASGTPLDLKRYLPAEGELSSDAELAAWRARLPEDEQALAEVSHLLYFTNGVTAVVPYPGRPFLMRAAPSAGGLYPTEIYVMASGHAGLPDGLYNYQVRDHSLLRFWAQDERARLAEAAFDHPALAGADMAVILTGVFERSAWRYEDRAYRRVLLDTGHVLGNLALYAPWVGRAAVPIGGFADAALDDMLFLSPEEEGALAIVALTREGAAAGPAALPSPRLESREVPEGQRLAAVHDAGKLVTGAPTAPAIPAATKYGLAFGEALTAEPIAWGGALGPTIAERRSTRAFSGESLSRSELAQLMDFSYRPDTATEPALRTELRLFVPELLETFVVVNAVEGLDPGCYHYDAAARMLRQIRFTELRKEARFLALGQDLASDAGAVVIHTADLPKAVAAYGDRAYRYLHLDAGQLGERLNVSAVRLGLGASGIGGFFDDQVNDLLGIPPAEAVLYLTTLGRPKDE